MSRKSIPYWHIDAFSSRALGGNQAAVMVLEEWLENPILQAIAEENNFAETAFLVADTSSIADYELRWFTPSLEIRLCGHATLAAGFVILSQDSSRDEVRFSTRKAGVLIVRRAINGGYEVALPAIETQQSPWPEASHLLGAEPQEVWRNAERYNVFLFSNEDEVRGLNPDFRGLAALGDHQFICTARGESFDVVSRVFVPGAGVDEDSVTGSAHGVLTPFWVPRLGQDYFTAFQASPRGGELSCRLAKGLDGETAWLGGDCALVVEGRFYL